MLIPSEIYVQTILPWIYRKSVKAMSHISGGLVSGVEKILPANLVAELDAKKWNIHPVYGWLSGQVKLSPPTILQNFNCGIGMVVVVSEAEWKSNEFVDAIEIG